METIVTIVKYKTCLSYNLNKKEFNYLAKMRWSIKFVNPIDNNICNNKVMIDEKLHSTYGLVKS